MSEPVGLRQWGDRIFITRPILAEDFSVLVFYPKPVPKSLH